MSHPVQDLRNESVGQWLPLIEYSIKSGVSLSTIRRKIKSNSIPYKLEKGKYLILFQGTTPVWDGVADIPVKRSEQPASPKNQSEDTQTTIQAQKHRIQQLEQELEEMTLLLKTIEQKYGVRY